MTKSTVFATQRVLSPCDYKAQRISVSVNMLKDITRDSSANWVSEKYESYHSCPECYGDLKCLGGGDPLDIFVESVKSSFF